MTPQIQAAAHKLFLGAWELYDVIVDLVECVDEIPYFTEDQILDMVQG